jgi:hypothetical protein
VFRLFEFFFLQILFHGFPANSHFELLVPTQTKARIPVRMANKNPKTFAARERGEEKRLKADQSARFAEGAINQGNAEDDGAARFLSQALGLSAANSRCCVRSQALLKLAKPIERPRKA